MGQLLPLVLQFIVAIPPLWQTVISFPHAQNFKDYTHDCTWVVYIKACTKRHTWTELNWTEICQRSSVHLCRLYTP